MGGPKEVLVGKTRELFVALVDENGHAFDNCSSVPVTVAVADSHLFRIESSKPCGHDVACPPGACQIFTVKALDEGETFATAHYLGHSVEIPLNAYHELQVSHPVVLVSLGSSFTVGVRGGPKAWKSHPGHHQEAIKAVDDAKAVSIVNIRTASAPESPWRLYTLTCKSLGQQKIQVDVRNTAPGTEGEQQTAQFEFRCKEPSKLYIYPKVELSPTMPDDCVESM